MNTALIVAVLVILVVLAFAGYLIYKNMSASAAPGTSTVAQSTSAGSTTVHQWG